MVPNAPNEYETHQNMCLWSNWEDRMRSLRKIPTRLRGTKFCIAPVWPILHRVLYCNQMVQNTSKMYETHHNISLGYNGVDRVHSLWKIPMRLCGTNFCTSSKRFAPSFVGQPNGRKCTQMVRNAPKHEFRVQWSGSSRFVAKNSDATSWHELLH